MLPEDDLLYQAVQLHGKRSIHPPPAFPVAAFPILRTWSRCGRDANGSYLATEFRALLDELGIDDPGERAAWFDLVDVIDAEAGAVKAERQKAEMAKLRER